MKGANKGSGNVSKKKLVCIGVLVYLCVVIIAVAVAFYLSSSTNDRLQLILEDESDFYVRYQYLRLDTSEASNTLVAVYNTYEELVTVKNLGGYTLDYNEVFLPLVEKSLKNDGYVSYIGFSTEVDRFFYLASATPIYIGSTVVGVICQLKEQQSLLGWILSAVGLVTFIAVCASICIYFEIRANEKYRKMRDSYIANISHSLKSPIASIRAMAETMSDGMVTDMEKIQNFSSIILSESIELEKTVMEMLTLSKMQTDGVDFTKDFVSAEELLSPAIEKYSTVCDDMGIFFHPPELEGIPDMYTSAKYITQLIDILLDNAVKFVDPGGDIWLRAVAFSDDVVISVRDNGIGIEYEFQGHIFDRFFSNSTHNSKGTGLGLAIAKEIANGLDEEIWFNSKPGEGSEFFFSVHTKKK